MEYVQLLVPLGLILWLAVWPLKGRGRWVHAAAVLAVVGLVALVGTWGWPSAWAPYGLAGLAVLAVLLGRRRAFGRGDRGGWLNGMALLVVAGVALAGMGVALRARFAPMEAVALGLPFVGRALVTQGGGHWVINGLRVVLDGDSPSLTSWKGAGEGVELIAVDAWGRAVGARLDVVAPCAGHVVLVTQDVRLGRAVVLDCAGIWVVLGGMDDVVAEGDIGLGEAVGQAVRLRVHAQTPGIAAHPFSGEARAVRLGERYAVRGMVLTRLASSP